MKLGLHTISLWFGLLMAIVVLAGAAAFAFTDFMSDRLFGTRRQVFVVILLAYGLYRAFRIYQVSKNPRDE